MKIRACGVRWTAVAMAMMAILSVGAGAVLADGEPLDSEDAQRYVPPRCPEDPDPGLPGAQWIDGGSDDVAAATARLVVMIATL